MPTYSYECTQCGNRFDMVQAFTDDALTTCEECSGRLRKLFNSVGIVFKGSGFYRTDSREESKKSKTAANASSTSDAASSSGSSEKNGSSNGSSEKSTSSPAPSTAGAST
ncbi:FmdB family zinc ribbon protein [Mycobacterium sp. 852002-51057_SCH5723018]|uniref:FmdB family zinc ribbon protein n=1 Tax=Mycobacterium sp. 852002-51057_SCH5723018 TaxID=1834094 RepID=UPI0007FC2830|nr:FmdB family zinc ribbon protein [Mycobacterium sp. 852002-51057_SCH5723018]OBG23055.1 FmdB family transcriptional regulator [Mycobacterium sp. 852002-51057_SCH5723018]